ncbi:MAG: transposase [Candidatus Dormibacteraeota bacterium]|nr:transposase [Candidatus Dormibacteraeota bacterium]
MNELVEEALNLSAIRAAYTEERGYPPYDPRLMVKLLIYGYCTGQRSSRVIEKRCWDDVGFRYLAAGAAPDYRSMARFRRRHLEALAGLFLQALQLYQHAGMVRLGKVALDGIKLRANANRHKAMATSGWWSVKSSWRRRSTRCWPRRSGWIGPRTSASVQTDATTTCRRS